MPLLPTMDIRQQTFQQLKPLCVGLSQAVSALNTPKGSIPQLASRLEDLDRVVASFSPADNPLDDKLADYIFFPLSQVLKLSQKVSIRCLELTLAILGVLIEQGWRQRIQPQLATQVLILCTLLAGDKPSGLASTETTTELRKNALQCLGATSTALGASEDGRKLLRDESIMPQLGQTLSTILDALIESVDHSTQVAAANALGALITSIDSKHLLSGFLPGLVSKLTSVLVPQTKHRRNHDVIVACLDLLNHLLNTTVNDEAAAKSASASPAVGTGAGVALDSKWFEQAATQLKPALASVFRLQAHERADVRSAISRLCHMVLRRCKKSLDNCIGLTLETIIVLAASQAYTDTSLELELLIRGDPSLAASLQELLHDWILSLPRIMQSTDEQAKTQRIRRIQTAYETLQQCDVAVTMIDRSLGSSLRDSVLITLQAPKTSQAAVTSIEPMQSLDIEVLDNASGRTDFGSALVQHRGQEDVMKHIEAFVETIGRSSYSHVFMADMERDLLNAQDDARIAGFWLLYVAAKSAAKGIDEIDSLLNMSGNIDSPHEDIIEGMYSMSLQVLSSTSTQPLDSRLKSLALRALALRAESAGVEFQYELIDALYPVLHTLATPDPQLQQDSIITLNIITKACEYSSTQELIVTNVDYLTNAVALKLNAFDVSPQAPQVLLMMVQLAGPSLLPYLEDTIESIFAALEDYHGYPLLVELLFKVLSVMAEEGVKAPQLAITDGGASKKNASEVKNLLTPNIVDLVDHIKTRSNDHDVIKQVQGNAAKLESAPREPWGDDKSQKDEDEDEEATQNGSQNDADEEVQPPAPKVYNLLLKITTLTQHFLPSASASLRMSLLGLIRTTVPAIAQHENSFLPLINTLWPEVTARLEDSEPNVQVTALEIVVILCEHAKSFMRSRMLQLWPLLQEIHQRVARDIMLSTISPKPRTEQQRSMGSNTKAAVITATPSFKQAVMRMKAAPADYTNTLTRMLWDAVIKTIKVTVQCVPLPPEKFDEALELLEPCLDDEDVLRALETQNADAVWLVKMRTGRMSSSEMPVVGEAAYFATQQAVPNTRLETMRLIMDTNIKMRSFPRMSLEANSSA
ncbi:hypothetical protein Q7P37_007727 [Cladosporium fusiforme]